MRQILENIVNFKTRISNLIHYEASSSNNKIEFHFHGPVNFISKNSKKLKRSN